MTPHNEGGQPSAASATGDDDADDVSRLTDVHSLLV